MLGRILIIAALCSGALLQSGCGERSANPSGSILQQPAQAEVLDTQQLLVMAQVTSETADPKPVGPGALSVAYPNHQTSDPIPVGYRCARLSTRCQSGCWR